MDIAPLGGRFGTFDGQLIVVGSTTGLIRAISASGAVVILNPDSPVFNSPETLVFVPLNLGAGGSDLEGLYSANWPPNVLKANANQFVGFKGDAIVMTEVGDQRISRLHWNGSAFETTVIGRSPNQAEEGFFLTPGMLNPGGSCAPQEQAAEHSSLCWPHCKDQGPRRQLADPRDGKTRILQRD